MTVNFARPYRTRHPMKRSIERARYAVKTNKAVVPRPARCALKPRGRLSYQRGSTRRQMILRSQKAPRQMKMVPANLAFVGTRGCGVVPIKRDEHPLCRKRKIILPRD